MAPLQKFWGGSTFSTISSMKFGDVYLELRSRGVAENEQIHRATFLLDSGIWLIWIHQKVLEIFSPEVTPHRHFSNVHNLFTEWPRKFYLCTPMEGPGPCHTRVTLPPGLPPPRNLGPKITKILTTAPKNFEPLESF